MKNLYLRGSFDLSLFLPVIILWIVGNLLVYSATAMHSSGPLEGIFKTQITWTVLGLVVIMGTLSVPTRIYYKLAPVVYAITLAMLLMVILNGDAAGGAARWIKIGPIRLQPSEFAKIGLLLMLAKYLTKHNISLFDPKSLIMPAVIIIVPFLFVVKQPDLGTALVFGAMSLPMFFWSGMTLLELFFLISAGISVVLSAIPLILSYGSETPLGIVGSLPWVAFFVVLLIILALTRPPKILWVIVIVANLVSGLMTNALWENKLHDYQKNRVISFVNPQADPRGAGYQVIQSMIAHGSGQSVGKGYLKGSQVNLSYLPEQHTDFIFAVLGEQFGFVGCVSVLLLFLFIIIRALTTTQLIRNRFSNLLLVGAASMLAFHILANVAMVIGMMPVTGLPLPLLSYGGSFALTISMLIGLMLNARADERNI